MKIKAFENMQIFKILTKSSSFIEGAWSLTLVQNYIYQGALQDGSMSHLRNISKQKIEKNSCPWPALTILQYIFTRNSDFE